MRYIISVFAAITLFLASAQAGPFGAASEAEQDKYSNLLGILGERSADDIQGDFVRLVVFPWEGYEPHSILVSGNGQNGKITIRESRIVSEWSETEPRLIKTSTVQILPPLSADLAWPMSSGRAFFGLASFVSEDCHHPDRYWVEARSGDQYNLIGRSCDRRRDGAAFVSGLIRVAESHFCADDLMLFNLPWFEAAAEAEHEESNG